jgi:phosphoserine phosphatase RsbU/P
MTEANLLAGMLEVACVFLIIVYMLRRFKFFTPFLEGKPSLVGGLILALVFGGLAIYGTYSGIKNSGAIVNIRDAAPMMAGLLGGPWVGLGAGLIGGIHRYFQPGFTGIPCALGTALSGLAAGLFLMWLKNKISIWRIALFAFCMQSFDMVLILVIARPFDKAVTAVTNIFVPMILGSTICLALFAIMLKGLRKEISRS